METPDWLDREEQRAWRAYVEASALLNDFLDQQLQSEVGLPHAHYAVLVRLSEASERSLRMSELAEALRITRSRLSHTVAKLEKSGCVTRREDPADARWQLATLTDEGARLLATAAPGHVTAVRRAVFDHLTREQIRQFADVCEAVTDAVTRAGDEDAYPAGLPWRRR